TDAMAALGGAPPPRGSLRRHPGVILLRCDYDVRPIFEARPQEAAAQDVLPEKRETLLATVIPPGGQHPQAFEVLPVVFDLLTLLDDWTLRAELASVPDADELIRELEAHALIEVRP